MPSDLFERLPAEILLPVLKQLPEITSLSHVLKASPHVYRFFETYGVEIFESILTSGTIHQYTSAIIRIVTMLRSSTLPPDVLDLESFEDMYVYETQMLRYPDQGVRIPLRLSPATPAATLRGIMASHCKNERLMVSCLKFYLDRFRPLRPLHVEEPEQCREEYEWRGVDSRIASEFVGSWEVKPEVCPAEVSDIGPPTWIEEQRVLRALWRNQLFLQLKTGATDGTLSSVWPKRSIQAISRYEDATSLWCFGGRMADPNFVHGDMSFSYHTSRFAVENELVRSTLEYAAEKSQDIARPEFLQVERDWPIPERTRQVDDEEEIGSHTSYVAEFFQELSGEEGQHDMGVAASPLQHVPWKPFRRLGFAIWCHDRMSGYGFIVAFDPVRHYHLFNVSHASRTMAWKSVLSQEEVLELERVNKQWQDEYLKDTQESQAI
ncbi:hypothetical protein F5Y10DRAFT_111939 [Nemania abortiva]|nr:hypothetical protein F5Y10DRAFT_111939 [Nemania abortiva]